MCATKIRTKRYNRETETKTETERRREIGGEKKREARGWSFNPFPNDTR